MLNRNSRNRLVALHDLFEKCYSDGIISYFDETDTGKEDRTCEPGAQACIFGRRKMLVSDCMEFNKRVRDMINTDDGGMWKAANGNQSKELQSPTWCVYELFRKIGVKPRFRDPVEDFSEVKDMLYYREWCFKDDCSYQKTRLRLQYGFKYAPEQGNRERKQLKKQKDTQAPEKEVT